ncbi:hypothetical protein OIU84_001635 [Salix udensis]|uniref:Uncharacterized protein n=1 Tax=Salix udensis TaxID=889485 RepID=A0AAD6K9Q8_9ROSI|nr:hypothetical protein OIU84_001635 [Salix udensis]
MRPESSPALPKPSAITPETIIEATTGFWGQSNCEWWWWTEQSLHFFHGLSFDEGDNGRSQDGPPPPAPPQPPPPLMQQTDYKSFVSKTLPQRNSRQCPIFTKYNFLHAFAGVCVRGCSLENPPPYPTFLTSLDENV